MLSTAFVVSTLMTPANSIANRSNAKATEHVNIIANKIGSIITCTAYAKLKYFK